MASTKERITSATSESLIIFPSSQMRKAREISSTGITSFRTADFSPDPVKRLDTKTPSILGTDDTKAFLAKPRFDCTSLRVHFKQHMLELRDMPYEFLEASLYTAASTNARNLLGKPIELRVVKQMHHICELKAKETLMKPEEIAMLNEDLERVLEDTPTALEEYKCIQTLLKIASSLAIKWGLVSYDEYNYRLNGRALHVRPLNLFTINSSLLSMETLWYSLVVEEEPLRDFIDVPTKQYAIVLRSEAARILMVMLRMNSGDFWKTPSIDGHMARLNPSLQSKYHMQADFDQKPPVYQQLRQPEGLLARFHKSPSQAGAIRLKKALRDFELAFRAFEKSLISCFMRKLLRLDDVEDE